MKKIFFVLIGLILPSAAWATAQPAEALVFLKKAIEANKAGSQVVARRDVDLALQDDPSIAEAYWLKALLFAQEGRLSEGKTFLSKGDTARCKLQKALGDPIRDEAQKLLQTKVVQQTVHFQITTSGQLPAQEATDLSPRLDKTYAELSEAFGVSPSSPIIVSLCGPEISWQAWKSPVWWNGFFDLHDGTVRWRSDDPPGGVAESERRLRHVLAHAFLKQLVAAPIPLWFNEGVASALETPVAERAARLGELHRYLAGIPPMDPAHLDAVISKNGGSAAELTAAERSCEAAVLELMVKGDGKFLSKFMSQLRATPDFDHAFRNAQ
jgi:hypothetical protein